MIEKFTPEELATIIDELTGNGYYALDKNAAGASAMATINNALAGLYGNKYGHQEQVKSAVYLLADLATGNVVDGRYVGRKKAVCINPRKYRKALDEIAKVITNIAAESDYKRSEPAEQSKETPQKRENGGLVYNALIAKLEAQKGETNE